jgi:alpha-glucosidase
MNVVDKVFPKSGKLPCRYHISCNVRGSCKGKTRLNEESVEFMIIIMGAWENILDSENEESYVDSVIRFRQLCIPFPTFIEYVESNIMGPIKEKVVTTWTKRRMHLGNTTTNMCESTHARLKKYIQDSMGDFIKHWEDIGEMLGNMFIEIHRRFEKGKIETTKQLEGNPVFSHIQRNISRQRVNPLVKEVSRVRDVGNDKSRCGCMSRTTMGLQCACELSKTSRGRVPISLEVIHIHWTRLSLDEVTLHYYSQQSTHSTGMYVPRDFE